jgi:hypothetical protein
MEGDGMMIMTKGSRYRFGYILFAALAIALGNCSTTNQVNNEPRAGREPFAPALAKQDTVPRLLDTILFRDVQMDDTDSAYAVIFDTNARVISLRAFVAGTDFVLVDLYIPVDRNAGKPDRAYTLLEIPGAEFFVSRSTGHVDVEVVTATTISPLVELCINCANGGPRIVGEPWPTQRVPSLCAGPWPIPINARESLQMEVYPVRPRSARSIRTMRQGPVGRDTIAQISWNCLRDDGADAGKGRYVLQITTVNIHGRSRRVHCCNVDVAE